MQGAVNRLLLLHASSMIQNRPHLSTKCPRAAFVSGVDRLAREFAGNFYKTAAWKKCRGAYILSVGGLCERCYANGIIKHGDTVHHKVHLTAENINDPSVTMNPENLELLCRDCHAAMHAKNERRYRVDEAGRVIAYDGQL